MATTTNFGWETPDDTDLVKDGAAAIRTALGGVDTSFVDLKGGTTGQVLSKASNTDLDFSWVAQDDSNAIQNAIVDAKGDLIAATAADTPARLAVGTNGQVLTADSTAATGLKWATAGGSFTKISTTTFSNVATQDIDSVFNSTYNTYLVVISSIYAATASDDLHLQMRVSSTTSADTYYGAMDAINYLGTSTITGANNATQTLLSNNLGGSSYPTAVYFYMTFPAGGGNSSRPRFMGQSYDSESAAFNNFGYERATAAVYTGFRLKSSSSNISGTVVVYGLEK